jgi:hypothetical protein
MCRDEKKLLEVVDLLAALTTKYSSHFHDSTGNLFTLFSKLVTSLYDVPSSSGGVRMSESFLLLHDAILASADLFQVVFTLFYVVLSK